MKNRIYFYAYVGDCWRVIVLSKDSPTYTAGESQRTEEGWSSWHQTFELDGDTVKHHIYTDEHDCDGQSSTHEVLAAHVDNLETCVPHDDLPFSAPDWLALEDYEAGNA